MKALVAIGVALIVASCSSPKPLPVVDAVDLEQYKGRWYEWARFDHSFEEGCECSVAEYTIEDDHVGVKNSCYEEGEWHSTEGKAFPVEGANNAKLEVQFFWPFRGDYFIMALDDDYQHALVGAPNRDYLWILARSPQRDEAVMTELKAKAMSLGFDVNRLILTTCDTAPPLQP